ncbi:sensor histidine kinase [Altericroceibacterium endophyticum]|uniref:histidine kinase n=1 Tax=Altericroceibacterium endophyticum TaxID=1808508 RepID=A0A6I4T6V4_9SPHN|nr:ATP-binding protein [Altericroceibacterium endophyticum]MXO65841.1 two-component sensor histidine kinase [Altericroceibacterium endophyticum]
MRRLFPRSLLGQMLLAVAVALFVAQGISAILLYRAQEQRREAGLLNAAAFTLLAEPNERRENRGGKHDRHHWRDLRTSLRAASPLQPGEQRDTKRETVLRRILEDQGTQIDDLVVLERPVTRDRPSLEYLQNRRNRRFYDDLIERELLIAGLRTAGQSEWVVVRIPTPKGEPRALGSLVLQTLFLYVVLVGGLALLLRRITRPIAALTRRVETFTETRALEGQIIPGGPADTRQLISAHNAMEERIAALLNEKDVMLGAIGHDLKTPLAALRVRIESVENPVERAKMATTIEDITRSLDDILSLARVGRPTDDLERTELSALVASVVEEFEDMGEAVELGSTTRVSLPLRATWLRRALRNLVSNALRYGDRARISVFAEGDQAVIRVDDDGPGIPEDEIDKMLQPFTRGDPSRNRGTGGAGLGLTLARAIAEQHGGTLVLRNRRDDGDAISGLRAELHLPTNVPQ